MASLPTYLLEGAVKTLDWEKILTNVYGGFRLIKNLVRHKHLLGWDESVKEKPDDGFVSHLGEDIAELGRDAYHQAGYMFET